MRAAPRGMTIIELMVAVAIVAVLAAVVGPGIVSMTRIFKAKSAATEVLSAISSGRDYSQRRNAIILVRNVGDAIVLEVQDYANWDIATGTFDPVRAQAVEQIVDSGWVEFRRYEMPSNIQFTQFPASLYFCPGSEGRHRIGSATGPLVCALGDVARGEPAGPTPDIDILFKSSDVDYQVRVSAAIGSTRLQLFSTVTP